MKQLFKYRAQIYIGKDTTVRTVSGPSRIIEDIVFVESKQELNTTYATLIITNWIKDNLLLKDEILINVTCKMVETIS